MRCRALYSNLWVTPPPSVLAPVAALCGAGRPQSGVPAVPPPCGPGRSSGRPLSRPLPPTTVALFLTRMELALCFVPNDAENHGLRDPPCRAAPLTWTVLDPEKGLSQPRGSVAKERSVYQDTPDASETNDTLAFILNLIHIHSN